MVKRAHALDDVEAEAGVPYERTRLARQAVQARRRLAWLLLAGAAACAAAAFALGDWPWLAGAAVLGLVAWGARAGRLGAFVAAALAAVLAVALPIRALLVDRPGWTGALALLVPVALGLGAAPPLVTLFRDAELQHAYGRWARREE